MSIMTSNQLENNSKLQEVPNDVIFDLNGYHKSLVFTHLHVKAWSVTTHTWVCSCYDLHVEWQECDLDPRTTPNEGAHQIASQRIL